MANVNEINGRSITTKKARPRLGHSAQAKWQRKKQAEGKCRACGLLRATPEEIAAGVTEPKLKQHCRACQDKVNAYMNKYRAAKKAAKGAANDNDTKEVSTSNGGTVPDTGAV